MRRGKQHNLDLYLQPATDRIPPSSAYRSLIPHPHLSFSLNKLPQEAEIISVKPLLPKLLFIFATVMFAGCESSPPGEGFPFDFAQSDTAECERYGPARIDILPLTVLTQAPDSGGDSMLTVYICLLDSYDSQIKSPAVFRFELFEHVQRSSEPKGKRVKKWDDIALMDPALNNNYWQDFLRAYLFTLPLEKLPSGDYILHATCITPDEKRLYDDYLVRPAR